MRITRWGEYGILCSLYIHENGRTDSDGHDQAEPADHSLEINLKTTGAADISKKLSIPLQYTQQILQRLRKGEIIESVRGPKGGYRLAKPAEDITLKDILLAMEGNTFQVVCEDNPLDAEYCCNENFCGLKSVWYDLRRTIDSFFENITLVNLAENHQVHFPDPASQPLVTLNEAQMNESPDPVLD